MNIREDLDVSTVGGLTITRLYRIINGEKLLHNGDILLAKTVVSRTGELISGSSYTNGIPSNSGYTEFHEILKQNGEFVWTSTVTTIGDEIYCVYQYRHGKKYAKCPIELSKNHFIPHWITEEEYNSAIKLNPP
jgi:hypothetical protein